MSLSDVRAAIDHIDDQIVALLAQRQGHVKDAARYKGDDHAVRAPDRRRAMMARLRDRASAEGVDPDVVTATYNAMIDAFVDLEMRERRARDDG